MKKNMIRILYLLLVFIFPGWAFSQGTQTHHLTWSSSNAVKSYDSAMAMKIPMLEFPESYLNRQLPSSVDNSKNIFWPGIKDQYSFMSCQQYCGIVYMFGYETNRVRNRPGNLDENSFPAHYTWNFLNQGEQFGVDFLHSLDVARQQGQMNTTDYGNDTSTDVLGWISGYDKYYRGMGNRVKQVYAINVNGTGGVLALKNYLYDHLDGSPTGGIACFTTSSYPLNFMYSLPPGTPEAGKFIVPGFQPDPNHGLTVVGYNDSIRFDINQDGQYTNNIDITGDGITDARDWEIGGFRLANSYGTWWGNDGFAYVLYRSFALGYDMGGIWNNRVYVMEADTAYKPLLTVKATLTYNARNKLKILAGVSSDTLNQLPEHVIDFPLFNFQGGEHAMLGNDTLPGDKTMEFGLDVTQLLNFIPSGRPARFFLMAEERDADHLGTGTISGASFISYQNSAVEYPVKESDVSIKDNNTTLVSAVATLGKPLVQITTSALPAFSSSQPSSVQLEATGGKPPYKWSLLEDYVVRPTATAEPLITGTSLQVHSETRSFATVALPFGFPFYGKRFDSIYVNYYGFIAFEPQHLPAPYTTDETAMLRMFPLIIPSFSQQYNYQFNKNDGIWVDASSTRVIIRWKVSVYPYITTSSDDFAVILYPDGRFEYCYGAMDNQGFVHTFYKGVSKGDDLNYKLQTQWNANDISGKSFLYEPPVLPGGVNLSPGGLLSVAQPDSSVIYSLHVRVADAGRISDSKELMWSGGLDIAHHLICGLDTLLIAGSQASMKLVLTNNGAQPLQNLALKLRQAGDLLLVTDSSFVVPLINPGQTITVATAFSFRLQHPLPNGYPVKLTLFAGAAARSWTKVVLFPVAAPMLSVESPYVMDGCNGRLDPGEVADIVVNVKNTGALATKRLGLQLTAPAQVISVLSEPLIHIDQLGLFSSEAFRFQVKVARDAQPGSEVPMQLMLSDTAGVLQTLDFNLMIGVKSVVVINLATAKASGLAMVIALDSLHVLYDTIPSLAINFDRYASIFLILGTSNSGSHALSAAEGSLLAAYLMHGGNLYMAGYNTWYYLNKTQLHPMFKYTSKKIPAYFYPHVTGIPTTITEGMSFDYSASTYYAIFSFEPVAPAYSTFINADSPAKNLEIAYDGNTYKTIGSMLDFSALTDGTTPSNQVTLMKRYLEFFQLNLSGPWPLFHAATTKVCRNQAVTFTDDSFNNITTRSWEFPGGTPATSTEANPSVTYNTSGKYDVKLTISDGIHTQTILKEKYILVDQCSGISGDPDASAMFRLYPNPSTDQVTIELPVGSRGSCKLRLYDLSGRVLMQASPAIPEECRISMKLSGIGSGLYFLRVEAGGVTSTMKLVKN